MQNTFFLFKALLRSRQGTPHVFLAQLAVWAVAVSTAAIIIVSSIMNGFHAELQNKIIGLNSHVRIIDIASLAKAKQLTAQMKSYSDVVSANPYMLTRARLRHDTIVREVFVKSIAQEQPVQIGYFLADSLGLFKKQAPVYLITLFEEFFLSGYARFETGLYDYDNNFVFLPENRFVRMFSPGTYTAGVEIYVRQAESAGALAEKIKALGYKTIIWEEVNRSLAEAMRAEKRMIQLILFFVTLLAGFSILSTVYMTIQGKRKSLALIRLVGVSAKQVFCLLLAYGFFVCFLGLCLGFLLSWLILTNLDWIVFVFKQYLHYDIFPKSLFFSAHIPVQYKLEDYFYVCYLTLIITVLGSLYPAVKAAQQPLVKDLRNYE